MFDFVHNNKSVQLGMKILLAAISVSFIGFGAANYSSFGSDADQVAKVGDTSITRQQVDRELQMRNMGTDKSEEMIQGLIQRQLLLEQARQVGITVSDADLREAIAGIPAFQKDGHFSPELYQNFLKENNISAETFESSRRNDLLVQQMATQLMEGGFVSKAARDRLAQFLATQREVSVARVDSAGFLSKVQVSDKDIESYYKAHSAEFQVPDRVKLEYIVLSSAALAAGQTVSEDEIKKFFDANKSQFEREERRASHILFLLPAKADAAAKNAVKAKAEAVLQEVKKDPSRFAALATQHSQDPGSAQKGGDLDWMQREGLDKKFADALFTMQDKQISDLVESQFGYHIIQLNGIKKIGLEEARPAITEKIKEQKARKQFPELSEQMSDLVVDNEKNLQPVAAALKLPLQTVDALTKDGRMGDPLFSNKDVLEKIFSADGLAGRATDVIELPDQQRMVARVVSRQAAHLQPLAEVAAGIRSKLQIEAAAKLAAAEGQRQLSALQKGEAVAVTWSAAQPVSRQQAGVLSPDAIKAVFALPSKEGDQYVGLAERDGYSLFKVGKTIVPPLDPMLGQQLQQVQLMSEGDAYLKALQREIPISRKAPAAPAAE